jgi:uncharacterized protein (TIGR02444 family)
MIIRADSTHMTLTNTESNPFWEFSLSIYAQPGVAVCCLQLQESAAVDVNVLLYACWCASEGWVLGTTELAAVTAAVEDWRRDVVLPLRLLRRDLREYPGVESTRAILKQAELEAEREQQQKMYCHSQSRVQTPGREALQVNLTQFGLFHTCDAAALAGFERVVKAAIRNLPADRRPV